MSESPEKTNNQTNTRPKSMPQGTGFGRPGYDPTSRFMFEKPKQGKKTFFRLIKYLAANIPILVTVFIISAVTIVLTIVATRISADVVDKYIEKRDIRGLGIVCLLLFAIYAVSVVSSYLQERFSAKLAQNTASKLREDLFGAVSRMPIRFYDTYSTGDLMSRLTNDVDTIGQAMSQNVTSMFSAALNFIGTLIAMLILSPVLTLIALSVIPVLAILTRIITIYSRRLFSQRSTDLGIMNGYIEEIISGIKVVSLFSREERVKEDFDVMNSNFRKSEMMANVVSGAMGPLSNLLNNTSYLLLAAIGGYMVIKNTGMTIGIVFAALQYKRQLGTPINMIANLFNTIQSALAAAERVFDILDEERETDDSKAVPLKNVQGKIEFKDVTFSYIPGTPVLKHANIMAIEGETVAIVGPTGAGKTTIISLLTRFYDADTGVISIDGIDVKKATRESLRKKIGMVLQDTYLFSETVRDNIRYGAPENADEDVKKAAVMAGAHGFISHLSNGYDTVLSDNGGNISQGQRQLLAIARAILSDPQVLILDEATSSVDTRTEKRIQDAMLELMKGRTCLVIAHRLSTIRNADKIVVISGGEVVETGTHDELISKPGGMYAKLYNIQFSTGLAL